MQATSCWHKALYWPWSPEILRTLSWAFWESTWSSTFEQTHSYLLPNTGKNKLYLIKRMMWLIAVKINWQWIPEDHRGIGGQAMCGLDWGRAGWGVRQRWPLETLTIALGVWLTVNRTLTGLQTVNRSPVTTHSVTNIYVNSLEH